MCIRDRDNALVARDFLADVRIMYALEFKEGAQLVSHGMMPVSYTHLTLPTSDLV